MAATRWRTSISRREHARSASQRERDREERFDKAYGYASSGQPQARSASAGRRLWRRVERATGKRTYMNMGTGGSVLAWRTEVPGRVSVRGAENLFEDFVENGWKADAAANAREQAR